MALISSTDHMGRNEEIEILRAIAVFFVLLHHHEGIIPGHPKLYSYLGGLFSGVDLFFCISGYVIGRSLIPKLVDKTGVDFLRGVALSGSSAGIASFLPHYCGLLRT